MSKATFTIFGTGPWLKRGMRIDVGGAPMVVVAVLGHTLTVRYLRWYERLWDWLRRKVGR